MTRTPSPLEPIVYAAAEIDGLPVRPDSREVVRKAVAGRPIEVRDESAYINLYHVLDRMRKADKSLRSFRAIRQKIGRSVWLMWILPSGERPPAPTFRSDYSPKRGRYKAYALSLEAGELVSLASRAEARKAIRAWQLYIPADSRRGHRANISKAGQHYVASVGAIIEAERATRTAPDRVKQRRQPAKRRRRRQSSDMRSFAALWNSFKH